MYVADAKRLTLAGAKKMMASAIWRPAVEPEAPNAWIFRLSERESGAGTISVSGPETRIESRAAITVIVTGFERSAPTRA